MTGSLKSALIYPGKIHEFFLQGFLMLFNTRKATSLGHCFENKHTWHHRLAWKMTLKKGFVNGNIFNCMNDLSRIQVL